MAGYVYDVLYHIDMEHPCYSVAWGGRNDDAVGRDDLFKQDMYYARTDAGKFNDRGMLIDEGANMVYLSSVTVRNAPLPIRSINFNEKARSGYVKIRARLVHPGQVNNMSVVPQSKSFVLTHTDDPIVRLWNFAAQGDGPKSRNRKAALPCAMLIGHHESGRGGDREDGDDEGGADEDGGGGGGGGGGGDRDGDDDDDADAPSTSLFYGLDTSTVAPVVVSGGSDGAVLVWDISRFVSPPGGGGGSGGGAPEIPTTDAAVPRVRATRRIGLAHGGATVEDVRWMPGSSNLFASVGDDRALRLWDLRVPGKRPAAMAVENLHGRDINTLSWCDADTQRLATGSDDGTAKVVDLRGLGAAHEACAYAERATAPAPGEVVSLPHEGQIRVVSWRPGSRRHLATAGVPPEGEAWKTGEHGVRVWDVEAAGGPEVTFHHVGHRAAAQSVAWNPDADWMAASSCSHTEDAAEYRLESSSVQVWQPSKLVTLDRADAKKLAKAAVRDGPNRR